MQPQTPSQTDKSSPELVVLLDDAGNAIGTADKVAVHHGATPLHLAFSCYIFNEAGEVLMTRRALAKRVFPGVWTNSVCGHPAVGESLADAVRRRTSFELGLELDVPRLVLPQFRYRAKMDGVVENEACPVLIARAGGDPAPNAVEVGDWRWLDWEQFVRAVLEAAGPGPVSPWCQLQVAALVELGPDPEQWPAGEPALLPAALPRM
jgi:isopentenyl-diphosphate delta-isomerase